MRSTTQSKYMIFLTTQPKAGLLDGLLTTYGYETDSTTRGAITDTSRFKCISPNLAG